MKVQIPKQRAPVAKITGPQVRRWDIHVNFSPEQYDRLVSIAREEDRSLANLVRRVVTQWLEWRHASRVEGGGTTNEEE